MCSVSGLGIAEEKIGRRAAAEVHADNKRCDKLLWGIEPHADGLGRQAEIIVCSMRLARDEDDLLPSGAMGGYCCQGLLRKKKKEQEKLLEVEIFSRNCGFDWPAAGQFAIESSEIIITPLCDCGEVRCIWEGENEIMSQSPLAGMF